jgi:hypothetical protein
MDDPITVELPNFGIQYLHGQHRGPNPPERCQHCGRPMRIYETQGFRFDPKWNSDGTPNIVRHAKCSALGLIRIFGFHDHAVQDAHGDWPWV